MKKTRLIAGLLTVALLTAATPVHAWNSTNLLPQEHTASHPFPDTAKTWCDGYVQTVYACGLMEGMSEQRFAPRDTLTNAQIVVISARLLSMLQGNQGRDIPVALDDAPWYQGSYQYISTVFSFDGAADMEDVFLPTSPCSRYAFVELLSGVLEKTGTSLPTLNQISVVTDVEPSLTGSLTDAGLSQSLDAAILAFYREGILNGVDAYGSFNGTGTLNRGQAAAMLARVVDPTQRMVFTPQPFDFCQDLLGVDRDTVLVTVNGEDVTAEEFSYTLASSMWNFTEDIPSASDLPAYVQNALSYLQEEVAYTLLAKQVSATGVAPAELTAQAASFAGYAGITQTGWLYRLRQQDAECAVELYYESHYASGGFHYEDSAQTHLSDDLYTIVQTLTVQTAPALHSIDWSGVAARRSGTPYANPFL